MQNSGFHDKETKETLKFFFSKTCWPIFKLFCRLFVDYVRWGTLYQIHSNHVDWLKIMAARGGGFFLPNMAVVET